MGGAAEAVPAGANRSRTVLPRSRHCSATANATQYERLLQAYVHSCIMLDLQSTKVRCASWAACDAVRYRCAVGSGDDTWATAARTASHTDAQLIQNMHDDVEEPIYQDRHVVGIAALYGRVDAIVECRRACRACDRGRARTGKRR